MKSSLRLKSVESKRDWDEFIELPWSVYQGDPNWVPPLRASMRALLDFRKNPFFKHATLKAWLVYRDEQPVGRIAGVIDRFHNDYAKEKVAFFGFFECLNDPEASHQLFGAVEKWAQSEGMEKFRGPVNPSTNHECGLLVEGFDDPPTVMMTYNPPYYAALLENEGFKKTKDLFAYNIDSAKSQFSEKLIAQAEKLRQGGLVKFRTLNLRNFDRELDILLDIYNDAWQDNWGFVPMNEEEFRYMAKEMKAILDPELILIAEVGGQPAGFALTLPDVNQAIRKVSDGKLLPFGLFKLLWNLKGPGRKKVINRCRILTLGIKKQYREHSIGALLYTEYFKRGPARGCPVGEASWILEDNRPMTRALELMCGERSKVYRIYDRPLSRYN